MRHTVIVGSSKTGTTGLFYSVLRGLEATGVPLYALYEIHGARPYDSLDKYAPERLVVAKLLVTNKSFDAEVAAAFRNRLLIVRDPRDTLVSALLFFPILAINKGVDDARIAEFTTLIRRKEQDPLSVSMKDLLASGYDLMGSTTKLSTALTSRFRNTRRYHDQVDSLVVKYEAFVDGELGEVEDFLSLELSGNRSGASRSHIERSGKYGGWKNWFLPTDVPYFRSLLRAYSERYGYDDDWEIAEQPVIDPAIASEYIERSSRSRREQLELFYETKEPTAERIALLRARSDTGRVNHSLSLARLLLTDGSDAATAEAVERLTYASCAGNQAAMRLLSRCYRKGVGVARDPERADFWRSEGRSRRGTPDPEPVERPLLQRVASRAKRALGR
ncbi:MAG: hypothetical protein M5T61_11560 [Acidimicrobiia bacterium]|nr:hypothetical protein [Acidimicrobiia bacterium]